MMRTIRFRFILTLAIVLGVTAKIFGQVLDVQEVIQEQDQWCWAAVSKCVLDYHGFSKPQCEIADYTRRMSSWHDFGSTSCCTNPNLGCNYWNYNWGTSGSIETILMYFGEISTQNLSKALSMQEIQEQLAAKQPFIFRWGWSGGGGHFLVGYGLDGNSMYYMDPWFNNGRKIATYTWVISGDSHTWTHTQYCIPKPSSSLNVVENSHQVKVSPNPASHTLEVKLSVSKCQSVRMKVTSILGKELLSREVAVPIAELAVPLDISGLPVGVYILSVEADGKEQLVRFVKQ